MFYKITKYIRKLREPKSPLKRMLYYLKFSIKRTEDKIDHIYSLPFEYCCHGCAYPELYKLEEKLARQVTEQERLEKKLDIKEK